MRQHGRLNIKGALHHPGKLDLIYWFYLLFERS